MPDNPDKQIADRLHSIFPNPQVASQIVRIVTDKRPMGTSHRSHYPYYKKQCAEEIKPFIDGMLENRQDIVYKYDVWCTENTGMSADTLYNRVNQSIRYLVERMDTDDQKYRHWYDSVDVFRKRGVGVIITFQLDKSDTPKPEFVQPASNAPVWRKKLDEWLESSNTEPFTIDKLALDQDEIKQLKVELAQLTSVIADITANRISIIKVNE